MANGRADGDLVTTLRALRDILADVRFPFRLDANADTGWVDAAKGQLSDYLLPRAERIDAPLLVVVGGSTGAGKSTIVNSLMGAEVTKPGVLRPTTRAPSLICHPADVGWFDTDRVLGSLPRLTGETSEATGGLRLVPHPAVPEGLAVVDAPDVDSVEETNRTVASQLLRAADLWLWVTTAARYADAVPWSYLYEAAERGTALAVVLNRVPPGAIPEVHADLSAKLIQARLGNARLFAFEEGPLHAGRLPETDIAPLRQWLGGLVADQDTRAALIRQSLSGALVALAGDSDRIATQLDAHTAAAERLRAVCDQAYAQAGDRVETGIRSGSLLRDEVLQRWQEVVGVGDWMRALQSRIGSFWDKMKGANSSREAAAADAQGRLRTNVEHLLAGAADRAALETVEAWRSLPGGPEALAGAEAELIRAEPGFAPKAGETFREWQGELLELVRGEGGSRRTVARALAWGVNSIGLALMVIVFAHTGGLTGGEVAVAGGTSALSQTLLSAVFGEQAARGLAAKAARRLTERVDELLAADAARFHARLDALVGTADAERSNRLRDLGRRLAKAAP